jgi:hypothetical protein
MSRADFLTENIIYSIRCLSERFHIQLSFSFTEKSSCGKLCWVTFYWSSDLLSTLFKEHSPFFCEGWKREIRCRKWAELRHNISYLTRENMNTLFIAHKRLTRKSNIIWNLNWIWLLVFALRVEGKGKEVEENICRSELVIQLTLTRISNRSLNKRIEGNWSMAMVFLPKRLFTRSLCLRERNNAHNC